MKRVAELKRAERCSVIDENLHRCRRKAWWSSVYFGNSEHYEYPSLAVRVVVCEHHALAITGQELTR